MPKQGLQIVPTALLNLPNRIPARDLQIQSDLAQITKEERPVQDVELANRPRRLRDKNPTRQI